MFLAIAIGALCAVFAFRFLRASRRKPAQQISPELAALLRANPQSREAKVTYMKALQRYAREGGAEDLSGPD